MSSLEAAIRIAVEAHSGQTDKAGAPYILHPLRVMFRVSTNEERMAAVLHDVVEDSEWSLDRLRSEGFPETVVRAIESVTHREGESYEEFVLRAALDPIGRLVKIADLQDNSDLSRIEAPTENDHKRVEKYRRALDLIGANDLTKL